jgi:hypothetical protein
MPLHDLLRKICDTTQQSGPIILEAIGHTEGHTVGRQQPGHLMHHTLSHRQGPRADVHHQQQLALGVHGDPHPIGRTLQKLNGLVIAEGAVFDLTQDRIQLIELQLFDMHVTEKIG